MKTLPPLTCPLCKSTHVSKDFTKKLGKAWLVTEKLYCYECKRIINTETGRVKYFEQTWWYQKEIEERWTAR